MEENATPPPERRCPACGAAMPTDARFCGACGMETLPASAANTANAPAAPVESPAPLAAAAAASGAEQTTASAGRACPWCGAQNSLEATSCSACGAVFPTPEGDEALERAARARIQAMESELKQPRGGWWPFRSR